MLVVLVVGVESGLEDDGEVFSEEEGIRVMRSVHGILMFCRCSCFRFPIPGLAIHLRLNPGANAWNPR